MTTLSPVSGLDETATAVLFDKEIEVPCERKSLIRVSATVLEFRVANCAEVTLAEYCWLFASDGSVNEYVAEAANARLSVPPKLLSTSSLARKVKVFTSP